MANAKVTSVRENKSSSPRFSSFELELQNDESLYYKMKKQECDKERAFLKKYGNREKKYEHDELC